MALVDRALDLDADERRALLDGEDIDPEVRADAQRLLDADAADARVLSGPLATDLPSALTRAAVDSARAAEPGRAIGPFRLLSKLGRGGMGEVWVAERTGADFEQRVAVKLLHGAGDGEAAVARFRRERQILARLSHPRIARLLDGGVTADGQPWLAMELVDGLPLVKHCVAAELGVDARLRLFIDVCDAVQFAHQNLVVHRDLKPSNILMDKAGAPKLLDFGIAKLLEVDGDETALTAADERPMTPDYASPEQLRGGEITTASDVWALGAILYELLTGVRAARASTLRDRSRDGTTTGGEAPRPSAGVDATAQSTSGPVGLSAVALKKRLRGDLDAIVMKAMRPEPHERYGTVDALAADVRRHLDGSAVVARGGARRYLLRTALRRHRIVVGVMFAVFTALSVGLVGTLWQARRAREETRKAEKAQEFLIGMLRAFDPSQDGTKELTQKDILARGEARVTGDLGDQPEVQARLLREFAETWYGLGDATRAEALTRRALAIQRSVLPARDPEIALTLVVLGEVTGEGALPPAEVITFHEEAAAIAREHRPDSDATLARALGGMAMMKRALGELAESERLFREVRSILRARFGDESEQSLEAASNFASVLSDEGKYQEAAGTESQMAALYAKLRGDDNPNTLRVRRNLARDLVNLGRFEEAERVLTDVEARASALFGRRSWDVDLILVQRGRALDGLRRYDDALAVLDRGEADTVAVEGPESRTLSLVLEARGNVLRHAGRGGEAVKALQRALQIRSKGGVIDVETARIRIALGTALCDEHHDEEARRELASALQYLEKAAPSHPDIVIARAAVACAGPPK